MRNTQYIGLRLAGIGMMAAIAALVQAQDGPPNRGGPPMRSRQRLGSLPPNEVHVEAREGFRIITSNGIPDHKPGEFPRRGNPNAIYPQEYRFRLALHPKPAAEPVPLNHQPFGIALNGVLFDPGTNEWWQNDPRLDWNMEAIGGPRDLGLDDNNAHVQPSGAYHYHGLPFGLMSQVLKQLSGEANVTQRPMMQVGWAADGYPIYANNGPSDAKNPKSPMKKLRSSYRLRKGNRPGPKEDPAGPGGRYDGKYTRDFEYVVSLGDLDECNGRTGVTPQFPEGTYYYVVTAEFPFVPRLFHAEPDPSFQRRMPPFPPGGPAGMRRGARPPPPDR